MLKRGCAAVLTLLLAMQTAMAQTWTEQVDRVETRRYATFGSEAPGELAEALAAWDALPGRTLCGAVRETLKADSRSAEALVAFAAADGGRELAGGWLADGTWRFQALGKEMLRQDGAFRIGFRDGERHALFVEYGEERYGFRRGFGTRPQLWALTVYEKELPEGRLRISADYGDGGVCVQGPGEGPEARRVYPANWVGWTAWLGSYEAFPATEQAAQALAGSSWQPLDGTAYGMLYQGVHLREKPTAKSRSLERCCDGALALLLGEVPGRNEPWYHVRVGGTEGYVDSAYMLFPRDPFYSNTLWYGPLDWARLRRTVQLRQTPEDGAAALCTLGAGELVQVLAEADGGWLHVAQMGESRGWQMDPRAACGYLRADEAERMAAGGV